MSFRVEIFCFIKITKAETACFVVFLLVYIRLVQEMDELITLSFLAHYIILPHPCPCGDERSSSSASHEST